jgi:single-stranded-DNA-specific exonuclease
VRGFSQLDMLSALESSGDFLKSFGGHKAAAGLNVEREKLEAFRKTFADAIGAQAMLLTEGRSKLLPKEITADCSFENDEELSSEGVRLMEKLAPFGMGNAEPVVVISGWKINGMKTLKERHLKIQFTTKQNTSLEGFWANGVGKVNEAEIGHVDIICLPQINSFRNLNRLELKIKDIRALST